MHNISYVILFYWILYDSFRSNSTKVVIEQI